MLFMIPDVKTANCLLIILIIMVFPGCATRPPVDRGIQYASWTRHQDKLSKLTVWEATGRISVRMEKEAWSASLQWHQDRQEYFLRLIAPLGRGSYEITGNEEVVFLRTGRDEVLQASTPETLMEDNFGWHVPLTGLIYWIRGLPAPGPKTDTLLLDEQGRIRDLAQSGWRVNFSSYSDTGGYDLPGKISLNNEKLKVRLVIKNWKI